MLYDTMKCSECGYENKDTAKFCTKCGSPLEAKPTPAVQAKSNSNQKIIIVALIAIIIILIGAVGFFAMNGNNGGVETSDSSQGAASQQSQSADEEPAKTEEVSSSKTTEVVDEKSWESIGKYSGSGSGSETIIVPEGKIKVKLSAYPIKNYATNHLYVTGSNGESGGVDWGSTSKVETRSDSFSYTSGSEETFTIDYYETVEWEVEFFRYQ